MYALSIAWTPLSPTTILPAPSVLKASAASELKPFLLHPGPNIKAGLKQSSHSHSNQVRQALWAHFTGHETQPQKT